MFTTGLRVSGERCRSGEKYKESANTSLLIYIMYLHAKTVTKSFFMRPMRLKYVHDGNGDC